MDPVPPPSNPNPHPGIGAAPTGPADRPSLGQSVGYRFDWHRRIRTRPRRAIGHLATSAVAFGDLVGRPTSSRAAIARLAAATSTEVRVPTTTGLDVRTPPAPYLAAWWGAKPVPVPDANRRRAAPPNSARLAVPERGLPQAVARRMRSRIGESTGPASVGERMVTSSLPIRRSPEITAVGAVLTTREANRATPRETRSVPGRSVRAPAEGDRPGPPAQRGWAAPPAVTASVGGPGWVGGSSAGSGDSVPPAPPRPEILARAVTARMAAVAQARREDGRSGPGTGSTRPASSASSTARTGSVRRSPSDTGRRGQAERRTGLLRTLRDQASEAVAAATTPRTASGGAAQVGAGAGSGVTPASGRHPGPGAGVGRTDGSPLRRMPLTPLGRAAMSQAAGSARTARPDLGPAQPGQGRVGRTDSRPGGTGGPVRPDSIGGSPGSGSSGTALGAVGRTPAVPGPPVGPPPRRPGVATTGPSSGTDRLAPESDGGLLAGVEGGPAVTDGVTSGTAPGDDLSGGARRTSGMATIASGPASAPIDDNGLLGGVGRTPAGRETSRFQDSTPAIGWAATRRLPGGLQRSLGRRRRLLGDPRGPIGPMAAGLAGVATRRDPPGPAGRFAGSEEVLPGLDVGGAALRPAPIAALARSQELAARATETIRRLTTASTSRTARRPTAATSAAGTTVGMATPSPRAVGPVPTPAGASRPALPLAAGTGRPVLPVAAGTSRPALPLAAGTSRPAAGPPDDPAGAPHVAATAGGTTSGAANAAGSFAGATSSLPAWPATAGGPAGRRTSAAVTPVSAPNDVPTGWRDASPLGGWGTVVGSGQPLSVLRWIYGGQERVATTERSGLPSLLMRYGAIGSQWRVRGASRLMRRVPGGPVSIARGWDLAVGPGSTRLFLARFDVTAALGRAGSASGSGWLPAPPALVTGTPGRSAPVEAGDYTTASLSGISHTPPAAAGAHRLRRRGRDLPRGTSTGPLRPVAFAVDATPAQRFTTVLRASRPDPVGSLPKHLRPIAVAIAGPAPVGVRSGPSTRLALAAAGKRAATVGRVIHLDHTPDRSARSAEVVAHELVHAARPSGAARFFDDDRHTHEEHLAVRVGGLAKAIATTELAAPLRRSQSDRLVWGTTGLSVGGGQTLAAAGSGRATETARAAAGTRPGPVRRRGGGGGSTGGRRGSVAQLIKQWESGGASSDAGDDSDSGAGGGPGSSTAVLDQVSENRSTGFESSPNDSGDDSAGSGESPAAAPLSSPALFPMLVRPPSIGPGPPAPDPFVQTGAPTMQPSPSLVSSSAAPVSEETLEWIIERIEQRIIDELERRGLRYNPGVF